MKEVAAARAAVQKRALKIKKDALRQIAKDANLKGNEMVNEVLMQAAEEAGKVEVADDLLDKIWKLSRGSVRRICVNLERVRQTAITRGQRKISLEDWGDEDFFTGEAPSRRV